MIRRRRARNSLPKSRHGGGSTTSYCLPSSGVLLTNLSEEQQRADLLRAHGLEPRHRVLLVGPPGTGKTTLAEAIAESAGVPLFVVRYETMIGSYLGETATRLKRLFDYARTTPCVLFFDEFDAIGKERGDIHETGEIKRVVTSLLMQVDDLPSYTIIAAATNHPELLDRASWRRFQLRLPLLLPDSRALTRYIQSFSERLSEADRPDTLRHCQTPRQNQLTPRLSSSVSMFKDAACSRSGRKPSRPSSPSSSMFGIRAPGPAGPAREA